MSTRDPRLGYREHGRTVYPQTDVNGNAYDRNGCSTLDVGGGCFVVLPRFGKADPDALNQMQVNAAPTKVPKPNEELRTRND